MDATKKARYMAEAKVLRAYFYYKLNIVYKGVPIYLEPVEASECYEGQSSEAEALGRAGATLLNSNTFTQVTGQDDLRLGANAS
ncbi:MAG: hypothetical protein MR387_06150 [Phocaeicola plebeius]|nr:hypothetical protein [Phocaeicola plebeius]